MSGPSATALLVVALIGGICAWERLRPQRRPGPNTGARWIGNLALWLLNVVLVTWLLLMLITVVATRQSRRTGGGEVTLFTVAPRETIGN